MSLSFQYSLTTLTFCTHLFCHDFLNFTRWLNVLNFCSYKTNSPWVSCLIQSCKHLSIDFFTRCKSLVKFHFTNDGTKCCCCQVLKTADWIFNTICEKTWIKNLHEYYRINLHYNVIFCDNRLRRKIQNLFL